ncbi:MAG: conjugative transposon protein TraN [Dysgonamonadaceae bacterium]|jgi:conjugative transposon TraN protein|nr:conjugative transposon protein TraN [Dysgonamonadaceae bacterium]
MKYLFSMIAVWVIAISAGAQETTVQNNPSTGDLFSGFTRPLTFNRMIPPYGLEVTFSKTVHIIFPASIRYVDLGSIDLLAAKADGAENVLRVKAATQNFKKESNLSVITDDGSYYTFNVKYADEPVKLSVEMSDFLHGWNIENKPGNELPVYLSDLGNESPYLVRLIMETIHKNNRTKIKHIGSRNFGIQYLLKGIYSHNELLFFHIQLKNASTVGYDVDYMTFKIVDKKVAKRTAIQEQIINPFRSYNQVTNVAGGKDERTVFALQKFTIPNDKQFIIELFEKDGGRNQTLIVENIDLVRAEVIDNLTVKVK